MRVSVYEIILVLLVAASTLVVGVGIKRTQEYAAGPLTTNAVVNGDFETGNFNGWSVNGVCSISNTIVHDGSHAAYISDATYDNLITQTFSSMELPLDNGLTLNAWIYPNSVGGLDGYYPFSGVDLVFYDNSTGQPTFYITYVWCSTTNNVNTTSYIWITFPDWSTGQWNQLQRDVTTDIHSYFGRTNFAGIYLGSIKIWYHFSDFSPGAFWVDDISILAPTINPPPVISSVSRTPNMPNYEQDVTVTAFANGADQCILSYNTDSVSWNNVTMSETGNSFNSTILAQPFNTTVQYEVYAYNSSIQNWAESSTYSYTVSDNISPNVSFVGLQGTSPYPLAPSTNIRQGEPFTVTANASDIGSGINYVMISYENNVTSQGRWTNTTMAYNSTTGLYSAILLGQPSGATVLLFITAYDNAENQATSSTTVFLVQTQVPGDINGNGVVDLTDLVILALHYGQHSH